MESKKILLLLLLLIVGRCFAALVIKTTAATETPSELIDAAINILTSCNENNGPIGILGEAPPNFLTKLLSKKLVAILLFDRMKRPKLKIPDKMIPNKRVQTYLVTSSTAKEAYNAISSIFGTKWFNPKASVFVINWSPNIKRCENILSLIRRFLLQYRLFKVNILCVHESKEIFIYTYNPFTNDAPVPWQPLNLKIQKNLRHFLFRQRYNKMAAVNCTNLTYGRTNNLGRTKFPLLHISDYLESKIHHLRTGPRLQMRYKTLSHMWKNFARAINATPEHLLLNSKHRKNTKWTAKHSYWFVSAQPIDIHKIHCDIIVPILRHKRAIVTLPRGNKSQLRKILTVIDVSSRFCVAITLLVTLLFLKFIARQGILPGILNVVRVMCNTGLTDLSNNLMSRIYLACLFLFIVTMHGIFAGDLASLLTKEIPLRHPVTVHDLFDMNYTIYIDDGVDGLIRLLGYKGKIITRMGTDCVDSVTWDIGSACIDSKDFLTDWAIRLKLYQSREDVFETYETFQTGFYWEFVEEASKIFLHMAEGNIVKPISIRIAENRLEEYQIYLANRDLGPRVMEFEDLAFIFVILGIGLACGTLTFLVEISIEPIFLRIEKVRKYFGH